MLGASWFFVALAGPLLWATTNHIDKYILTHHLKGRGVDSLMLFSTLVALPLLPIFYVLAHDSIRTVSPTHAAILLIVGILSAIAIWFYLYALEEEEASIISPLFQTIPLFGAAFAYLLLGETLSQKEAFGCFLIIAAAMILTLELDEEFRVRFKTRTLLLMLGSALLFGFYETMFKVASLENDFWAAIFWEHLGLLVVGLALLTVPRYRHDFMRLARDNGTPILGLNIVNETITIGGNLATSYALLLAPVALVLSITGIQPFLVFATGTLLTLAFPHLVRERITMRHLAHKLLAISIMFAGVVMVQ